MSPTYECIKRNSRTKIDMISWFYRQHSELLRAKEHSFVDLKKTTFIFPWPVASCIAGIISNVPSLYIYIYAYIKNVFFNHKNFTRLLMPSQ